MAVPLLSAHWRPDERSVARRAERLTASENRREAQRVRRENEMPMVDDRPGHCWRCSHVTHNPERTCDFCLAELVAA